MTSKRLREFASRLIPDFKRFTKFFLLSIVIHAILISIEGKFNFSKILSNDSFFVLTLILTSGYLVASLIVSFFNRFMEFETGIIIDSNHEISEPLEVVSRIIAFNFFYFPFVLAFAISGGHYDLSFEENLREISYGSLSIWLFGNIILLIVLVFVYTAKKRREQTKIYYQKLAESEKLKSSINNLDVAPKTSVPEVKEFKLTAYHIEKNRRELEANKRMPKVTPEKFKEQARRLKEYRYTEESKRRIMQLTKDGINKKLIDFAEHLLNVDPELCAKYLEKKKTMDEDGILCLWDDSSEEEKKIIYDLFNKWNS